MAAAAFIGCFPHDFGSAAEHLDCALGWGAEGESSPWTPPIVEWDRGYLEVRMQVEPLSGGLPKQIRRGCSARTREDLPEAAMEIFSLIDRDLGHA